MIADNAPFGADNVDSVDSIAAIEGCRVETPASLDGVYLNTASAGLTSLPVTQRVVDHLQLESRAGINRAAAEVSDLLTEVRRSAAKLLGADRSHVAFGETSSRLWASAMTSMPVPRRARILVAPGEWSGNVFNLMRRFHAEGVKIEKIPTLKNGLLDVEQLETMIDETVVAVCVTLISSGSGLIQPAKAIGALARPDSSLLLVDAAQAIGHLLLDLPTLNCDVLTAPARKWLRGPRGQAIMALSERALQQLGEPVIVDQVAAEWTATWRHVVRGDARRFESFDFSVAGRLGLGVAIERTLELGLERIRENIAGKIRWLRARLAEFEEIAVLEAKDTDAAFLTFACSHIDHTALCDALARSGITIGIVGTNYARWELEGKGVSSVLRISPHIYTSSEDLEEFVGGLAATLRDMKA